MGAWHKSAWYGSSWYNSAWYGGTGGGGAAVATGGGNAIDLGFPGGWREITDAEIRSSERRARAREEAKRRKRRKVAPTKPAEIAPAAASPIVTSTPSEVDRLIDAIANPDVFTDLGKRTREQALADALADALARARETAELIATERRVTVGKVSRRSVVRGARSVRARAGVREVTRKAAPRVMVREEERRCEASTDRRSVVSTLTRLVTVRKYDPDQPRDEAGRFGESGSGRSAAQGTKTRSGNNVTFRSYSDDPEKTTAETVNKTLRAVGLTGKTLDDIPLLIGATSDVEIRINADAEDASIRVSAKGDGYEMSRTISKGEDGKVVISNESFEIDEDSRGKGLGTSVFASQVEAAARMGVDRIETIAAGQKGGEQNGYYTWARLGYDGEIPSSVKGRPLGHEQAKRVSELMGSKEGREWWKDNGKTFNGSFSLNASSTSRQALSGYIDGKAAGRVNKARGGVDADVLTEEDEKILDEVWERISEQAKVDSFSLVR